MESIVKMGSYAGVPRKAVAPDLPPVDPEKQEEEKREKEKLEKRKLQEQRKAERELAAAEERRQDARRRKQYKMIAQYVIGTVVISYILLRATDNLGVILSALGKGVRMVALLLRPLFWGFVLAYILTPAVNACERRLRRSGMFAGRRGGRRGPAVAITGVVTLLGLGILLSIVVSAVSRSLRVASLDDLVAMVQSFAGTLSSFQQTIMEKLSGLNISSSEVASGLRQIGAKVAEFTSGLSTNLTGAVGHIGGFLTNTLFAVIFAIYFLLDGKALMRYWNRVLLAIGGRKTKRDFHILAKDADAVFSGYIRGQLIDALIMAVLVSVSLSLIGVRYAVIIGVMSGLGNLIPYVGPVVAYGSTIVVCLLSGDLRRLLVALVVLFVIQTIDGNVINPRLLSSNVDVHPMLVIAALIVGGAAGGLVGMLFAVPVAAFLKIQFDKIIDRLLEAREPVNSRKRIRRAGKARSGRKTARKASAK